VLSSPDLYSLTFNLQVSASDDLRLIGKVTWPPGAVVVFPRATDLSSHILFERRSTRWLTLRVRYGIVPLP
jgi:hypothetical protein